MRSNKEEKDQLGNITLCVISLSPKKKKKKKMIRRQASNEIHAEPETVPGSIFQYELTDHRR